jgi:hypothetical protein
MMRISPIRALRRLPMCIARIRITMFASGALAAFYLRERGSCEGWDAWEISPDALKEGSLLRIDRLLARYEHRYGWDEFAPRYLLHAAACTDAGTCAGWRLVTDAHRLDEQYVLACAHPLHMPEQQSLVEADHLVRLWRADLADHRHLERMIDGGRRIHDHHLPQYGFDARNA